MVEYTKIDCKQTNIQLNKMKKFVKDGSELVHWIALYVSNNCIYFDSFGVEYIPNEIKQFIGNKDIISNIFRLQAYDSIMCGYFCLAFIDFMHAGKTLLQFTNLFSPYDFKKNDKIVGKMFK